MTEGIYYDAIAISGNPIFLALFFLLFLSLGSCESVNQSVVRDATVADQHSAAGRLAAIVLNLIVVNRSIFLCSFPGGGANRKGQTLDTT